MGISQYKAKRAVEVLEVMEEENCLAAEADGEDAEPGEGVE